MSARRSRDDDGGPQEPDDLAAADEPFTPAIPPAEVIAALAAGRSVPPEQLRALSAPADTTVQACIGLWPRIPAERRRELLAMLQDLAAEDATLDFHRVHLSALRDPDAATRMLAIEGLWEQDHVDYLRLLLDQARSDPAATVRAAIADALAQWVVSAEFGLLSEQDAEHLAATLREVVEDIEEEDEVRARALEALGASSEESVTDLIVECYETGNYRMRIAALRAMGRNADDRWLAVLLYCFDDEDAEVRAAAATASGQLLLEEAIDPLTQLFEDTEEDVQVAAIGAIGEIGGQEAERVLTALLGHQQRALAYAAQQTLNGLRMLQLEFDDADGDGEEGGA